MFCAWVNALGYCGLNVPGKPHSDGRPIGVQLAVRRGDDGLAIALADRLERRILGGIDGRQSAINDLPGGGDPGVRPEPASVNVFLPLR